MTDCNPPRVRGSLPAIVRHCLLIGVTLLAACSGKAPEELYARAEANMQARQWRGAMIDLKNLLQRQPEHAAARFALGQALLELGDPEGALQEIEHARRLGVGGNQITAAHMRALAALGEQERALETGAEENIQAGADAARIWTLRGESLFELGRAAAARDAYDEALRIDPGEANALAGRALAKLPIDGLEAALEDVDAAQARAPSDPRIALARASLYLQSQRHADAEREYTRAATLTSGSARPRVDRGRALFGLSQAQLAQGKVAEADKTTAALLADSPRNPAAMYQRARALLLVKRHDEARQMLEQILAVRPDEAPVQLLLGTLSYAQGNLGQAEMYLSAVAARDPDNAFVKGLLARVRSGDRKAAPEAERAATIDDPDALLLMGAASILTGDRQAGLLQIESAAALQPQDAGAQLELASAYLLAGDPASALAKLKSVAPGASPHRREFLTVTAMLAAGQQAQAIQRAEQLARENPRDAQFQFLAASVMTSARRHEEGLRYLRQALAVKPKDPNLHVAVAKLEMASGDLPAAELALEQAAKLDPQLPELPVLMALLDMARGNVDGAVRRLQAARQARSDALGPRVMLAQHYLAIRNFGQASELAEEARRIAPDNARVVRLLAQAFIGRGNPDAGILQLSDAARTHPKVAEYEFAIATLEQLAKRNDKAIEHARAALRLDPTHPNAMLLLATLLTQQGKLGEARGLAETLQRLAPSDPNVAALRGSIALADGKFGAAVEAFERVARSRPSTDAMARLAEARLRAGMPDANAPLRDWLARHPRDAQAAVALAQAQVAAGDRSSAIQTYTAALQLSPGNPVILNNLAWVYHEQKDARALLTAQQAYATRPDSADIADTYGWLLMESGATDRGLELLGKAAAMEPLNGEIQYHFASALARAGETQRARQILGPLVSGDRAFASKQEALALFTRLGS